MQQNLPGPPPNFQETIKTSSHNTTMSSAMTLSPGKLDKNKLKMQKRYVTPQLNNFPNLSMSEHMYQEHKTPMKPRGKLPSLNLDN
jgi:hypothetical protein